MFKWVTGTKGVPMTRKVFIDNSGSTGGNTPYWTGVKSVLNSSSRSNSFLWGSRCIQTSDADIDKTIELKQGNGGGTVISSIVQFIESGDSIVIITDGAVDKDEVQRCYALMHDKHLACAVVHFIGTGQMNLTVSSPFSNATSIKIIVNGKILTECSGTRVDLAKYLGNIKLFLQDLDGIVQTMKLHQVGKEDDPKTRADILFLQKNLLHAESTKMKSSCTDFGMATAAIQEGSGVDWLQDFLLSSDDSIVSKITAGINMMLSTTQKTSYDFASLQPNRLSSASTIAAVMPVEPSEEYSGKYEGAILMEGDHPMIPITAGDHITMDLPKDGLDMVINMPLELLLVQPLRELAARRLDHPVTWAEAQLLNGQSAMTRKTIVKYLVLAPGKENRQANISTLATLFFNGKLVGNIELYLYVIYEICLTCPWINDCPGVMDAFKSMIIDYSNNSMTNMSLSGLVAPLIKVPLPIAVYYILVSHNTSDVDHKRRLKNVVKYLVAFAKLFHFQFDEAQIIRLGKIYRAFQYMMNCAKGKGDINWRKRIIAQFQKAVVITIDSIENIILLDGPATASSVTTSSVDSVELPPILENLDFGIPHALAKLVDISKTVDTIPISFNIQPSLDTPVTNFGYTDRTDIGAVVIINANTCRPVYGSSGWAVQSREIYGDIDKQLSIHNFIGRYVVIHGTYPTVQQLIIFMAHKVQNSKSRPMSTLPSIVVPLTENAILSYAEAFNLPVNEFIRRWKSSMPIAERIRLEKLPSK